MRKFLILFIGLMAAWSVSAKVDLPEIVGDNMVLQQNAVVNLWGWSDPRAAVKIEASWGERSAVKSGDDGRWTAQLKTPAGGYTPQQITITSGDKVTLNNILIGEVWFASGQSNMDMPLGGYWNGLIEGANEVIACAGSQRGSIRFLKVSNQQSEQPLERAGGKWNEFGPATAPRCSATSYFFASMLNAALDVPVGVIDSSWGGSPVESWIDRATLEGYSDIDLSSKAIADRPDYARPMVMYNAMVRPVTDYTVKGFIWYQGESNIGRHADYGGRMADMVALWRKAWGSQDMPFYFVEIAPFGYGHNLAAFLREAQCRAQELIPNSGMVCTNDLVEPCETGNIHPKNKRDVGHRLAFWALNKSYGMPSVACESMRYKSMEAKDGKIYLRFDHTGNGFGRVYDIQGFEICGPDRVFHPARVEPESNVRLIVSSPEVAEPVSVRYCFRDFMPGNMINTSGLPLIPFRTDDFPF